MANNHFDETARERYEKRREIQRINRKWESPELNKKLEEGDLETVFRNELDRMRRRELANGL